MMMKNNRRRPISIIKRKVINLDSFIHRRCSVKSISFLIQYLEYHLTIHKQATANKKRKKKKKKIKAYVQIHISTIVLLVLIERCIFHDTLLPLGKQTTGVIESILPSYILSRAKGVMRTFSLPPTQFQRRRNSNKKKRTKESNTY